MNVFATLRKGSSLQGLILPVLSALVVLVPIVALRPLVLGYNGLNLLLNMAMPLGLATVAQMFAMTVSEIDFSMGNLVSLVTCIVGTILPAHIAFGLAMLAGIVAVYIVIGALLHLRGISSIVVTIGMSFIWTGLAVTIQPSPGGNVPFILQALVSLNPPFIPLPILFLALLAIVCHFILFRTNFGVLVRGVGGNIKSISQSGHSIGAIKAAAFGIVGLGGVLAGVVLAGVTTSADANIASNYTLLSVAGVMLGGGSFAGGKVSAVGAVIGACIMTLIGTLLTFLQISTNWQIGAQGMFLVLVLLLNHVVKAPGRTRYV